MENEIWKNVHIDAYNKYYEVSTYGNVRSLKKTPPTILKQHLRCGYRAVYLENNIMHVHNTENVHKLVAYAFLTRPKDIKYVINHKDGSKMNNTIKNLEFTTYSGNLKHAMATGLKKLYQLEVEQYDMSGKLLNSYSSIKEASIKTETRDNYISAACKGNKKSANGYIWKYKNKDNKLLVIDMSDEKYIRQISGYERYYATIDGKIYSKSFKRFLKQKTDGSGYKLLTLHNKGTKFDALVHRLIAAAFIENVDNKAVVNHINKNKSDNRVENLEWVTYSENMIHANK